MQLYHTPGGTWAGTEKDYKAALKAEGIDPKTYDGRRQIDVPVDKKGLMEFLTFYQVNCIDPGRSHLVAPMCVVQAQIEGQPIVPLVPQAIGSAVPVEVNYTDASVNLDNAFLAAPLGQQLTLAALACEAARKKV